MLPLSNFVVGVLCTLYNCAPVYSILRSHIHASGLLVQTGLFNVSIIHQNLTQTINKVFKAHNMWSFCIRVHRGTTVYISSEGFLYSPHRLLTLEKSDGRRKAQLCSTWLFKRACSCTVPPTSILLCSNMLEKMLWQELHRQVLIFGYCWDHTEWRGWVRETNQTIIITNTMKQTKWQLK